MLLVFLIGCYDRVSLDFAVDLRARETTATARYWNAWPSTVGCEGADAATCAAGVRQTLARDAADLAEKGVTVTTAAATIREGELDLVYVYEGPLAAEAFGDEGFRFVVVEEDGPCRLTGPRERVALVTSMDAKDEAEIALDVRARARRIVERGDETRTTWIFRGRRAQVHLESRAADSAHGPWTDAIPGLEAALRDAGVWLGAATAPPIAARLPDPPEAAPSAPPG